MKIKDVFNKENAAKVAGLVIPIICYSIINAFSDSGVTCKLGYDNRSRIGAYTYSDAIDAITCSDMMDTYKRDALKLIKQNKSSNFYKSVVSIISSTMMDTYKIDAIKDLVG